MPAVLRLNGMVILLSLMAMAVLFCGPVQAQESVQNKTFVVIGSSNVHAGNVQTAREAAIQAGLVTAVARMTAEILKVEALVDNFPKVNELIYEQPDKYVQNYKVAEELRKKSKVKINFPFFVSFIGSVIPKLCLFKNLEV